MHRGPMAKNPGESAWERPSRNGNRAANKRIKADHTQGIRPAGKLNRLPDGLHASPEPTGTNRNPSSLGRAAQYASLRENRSRNKPSQAGNSPKGRNEPTKGTRRTAGVS